MGDMQEVGERAHGGAPAPSWEQYYQLEARTRQLESRAESFDCRLEAGVERFSTLEKKTDEHCAEIRAMRSMLEAHSQHVNEMKQLLEDIKAMLQVFESARGTVMVLGALGGFLKWTAGVGAAGVILWVWLKTGIKS